MSVGEVDEEAIKDSVDQFASLRFLDVLMLKYLHPTTDCVSVTIPG